MDKLDYTALKQRHRDERAGYPQTLSLRIHRALSWLQRAEQENDDPDAQFIFLWIAFNAAYAQDLSRQPGFSERRVFMNFLERLIDSDTERLLYNLVWSRFAGAIRLLLDNQYVFQPFWDHQNGLIDEKEWREGFERSKESARRALGRVDTQRLLAETFDRLYTLRIQLLHGGATWAGGVNRTQIQQGAEILGLIVPIVIHLMMESPNQLWGEACYPVVD